MKANMAHVTWVKPCLQSRYWNMQRSLLAIEFSRSHHFWSWHYAKPLLILNSCSRPSSLHKFSIEKTIWMNDSGLHKKWSDNDLFHRDSWLNRITDCKSSDSCIQLFLSNDVETYIRTKLWNRDKPSHWWGILEDWKSLLINYLLV